MIIERSNLKGTLIPPKSWNYYKHGNVVQMGAGTLNVKAMGNVLMVDDQ